MGSEKVEWIKMYIAAVPGEMWKQLAWKREHIPILILVAYLHTSVSQLNPSSTSWVLQVRGRKWYLETITKLEIQLPPSKSTSM